MNKSNRKITDDEANTIRKLYDTQNYSVRELGKMFNISKSSIHSIVNNKTYNKNVSEELLETTLKGKSICAYCKNSVVKKQNVETAYFCDTEQINYITGQKSLGNCAKLNKNGDCKHFELKAAS